MSNEILAMVDTLRKSTQEIAAADVDNRDDLLAKSFDEFAAALSTQLEEIAQPQPAAILGSDEELYKGLGCVGRVANMLKLVAGQIELIKTGCDYQGQSPASEPDLPSPETQVFLDQALASTELAMRAAVNEHVDLADDGDDANVMVLKAADGGDLRVKTDLLPELAKFATDPELLDQAAIVMATQTLVGFGVPEESLEKFFSGLGQEPLAKGARDAGTPPKAGAKPELEPNDGTGDAGQSGGDASMDDGSMDDGSGAGDGTDDGSTGDPLTDLENALNLVGRLQAASLIQLQHVMEQLSAAAGNGADDGSMDDNGTDDGSGATPSAGADPGASAPPAAPPAKKPPFGKLAPQGELAKAEDPRIAAMQQQMAEMNATLAKVLQHPEAPKALLSVGGGLSKSADSAAPGAAAKMTDEEIAAALQKMAPDAQAVALLKIQRGMEPSRALAKIV